jgi:hypothetical protein
MRAVLRLLSLLLLSLCTASPVLALTITLNVDGTSRVSALATNGGAGNLQTVNPVSLPTSGAPTATQGPNQSTTPYSLSNASFQFSFDNLRGTALDAAASSLSAMDFSPDSNIDYVLSGVYTSDAPEGSDTFLRVDFYDFTASQLLFFNIQRSLATPAESFVLGQQGGDAENTLQGSLTGTLIAGHHYLLTTTAYVAAYPSPTASPARGTGYVTLAFVPEPGTGLLVIAGLLGVAGARRARR